MKKNFYSIALMALFAIGMVSCDKKESPKVTIHELGYDNTKKVVAGNDLHIDAEIIADYKIASIQLIIHSEAEHMAIAKVKSNLSASPLAWTVDSIYTNGYAGVKNTEFHEHLEVPLYAVPGDYHFHMKVTDMDGNQTIVEDELTVEAAVIEQ